MSVKELKFGGSGPFNTDMGVSFDDEDKVMIELNNGESYAAYHMNRNQAHLLLLYLQEHLKKLGELQLLICDQIKMYEYVLDNLNIKNKSRSYYERNRKEALNDLLNVQLKEFNHD